MPDVGIGAAGKGGGVRSEMQQEMQQAACNTKTMNAGNKHCLHVVWCILHCLLFLALVFLVPASAQSTVQVGGRQLVVPFENATHEPRLYWLGEASAVALTDDLVTLGVR